jgi:acyl carrier protein
MNEDTVRGKVRQTMMSILELESQEMNDAAHFSDDFDGDSIQKLELIVTLEKEFNIHYAVEDAAEMNSVDQIVQITRNYL